MIPITTLPDVQVVPRFMWISGRVVSAVEATFQQFLEPGVRSDSVLRRHLKGLAAAIERADGALDAQISAEARPSERHKEKAEALHLGSLRLRLFSGAIEKTCHQVTRFLPTGARD